MDAPHPPNDAFAGASTAVAAVGLNVVRRGKHILREISLRVPEGVVYGLVGPSGCGKTTLMRAIVGRQRIAGGTLTVLGFRAGHARLRSMIGYMPQDAAIYEELTARENLEFFAAAYGAPDTRIDEVLRLVDLKAIARRPVATYSGGQRRRVALACALIPSPRLLVLDEPTVGLDPRLRFRLWERFRVWAETGTTLLVSTHVMDEAAHVDRLVFLSDGCIVAEGTPAELRERAQAPDLETAVLRLTESGTGEEDVV